MGTYIDGIGASENIDSSGEIVSIAGLDISSLEKDGNFTWEHKNDTPGQIIGKILKARKIFSDADCEDDRQLYYWSKCKTPYVYVMGELFDDYKDSAREVAGMFKYDADHKNQNERNVMNFSVEGSKISKDGIIVSRSIARKITLTATPCNKAAVAEMISTDPAKPKKGDIDELFKTEATEIEVFTPNQSFWNLLKKEDPNKHAAKLGIKPFKKDALNGMPPVQSSGSAVGGGMGSIGPTSAGGVIGGEGMMRSEDMAKSHTRGDQIGLTSNGHGIFSHGMVGDYSHFSHSDHNDAAAAHQKMAEKLQDPKQKMHHGNKSKLHAARATTLKLKSQDRAKMNKALDAGSALASPANLTGGAALGKEELKRGAATITMSGENMEMVKASANPKLAPKDVKVKQLQQQIDAGTYKPDAKKISDAMKRHPEKPLKKSAALMQAEHAYQNWEKREQFESFMRGRMPHLTKSEIKVIGQTMLMNKSFELEKSLKKMFPLDNYMHSYVAKKEKK